MNNEYKRLEITPNDIKDAALVYAEQFDLYAQRSNCSVRALSPKPLPVEIGGEPLTNLPVTQWIVTINTKDTTAIVLVEYLTGGVCAMDFKAEKKEGARRGIC